MEFKTAFIKAMTSIGKNIGAELAAIGLTGAGVGLIFASYISCNKDYEEKGFKYVMLGFALTEAVGLLIVAFLILGYTLPYYSLKDSFSVFLFLGLLIIVNGY